MSDRIKGLLNISANFEPQLAEPFDGRLRVKTKASLLLQATWESSDGNVYIYNGIVVSVYNDTGLNNGLYRLKEDDYTIEGNWEKIGSGGGTLNQSYDFGGAGAGRSITADAGAVEITTPVTSNNPCLTLNQNIVGSAYPTILLSGATNQIYGNPVLGLMALDDITFNARSSGDIYFNTVVDPILVGFTKTSIIGALNELKSSVIIPSRIESGNTFAYVRDTGVDGYFAVATEGVERLKVNSSGNVGVGVEVPTSSLDVNGDVEVGLSNWFYYGDPSTNGTWRTGVVGGEFMIEKRESGLWVAKGTFS